MFEQPNANLDNYDVIAMITNRLQQLSNIDDN